MSGSLALLLGMNSALARISDQSISSSSSGASATAGYRLTASGLARSLQESTYTTLETWLLSGIASGYEARATLQAGTLTNGTLNTWLGLSADREWSCVDTTLAGGPVEADLLIEIRSTSGVVLDSATISLSALREL